MPTLEMSVKAVGAWSDFSFDISQEAKDIFTTASGVLTGVGYTPIAVATQVDQGRNYSFLCKSQPVYPNAPSYAAIVNIYQPLNGKPSYLKGISTLNPHAIKEA